MKIKTFLIGVLTLLFPACQDTSCKKGIDENYISQIIVSGDFTKFRDDYSRVGKLMNNRTMINADIGERPVGIDASYINGDVLILLYDQDCDLSSKLAGDLLLLDELLGELPLGSVLSFSCFKLVM